MRYKAGNAATLLPHRVNTIFIKEILYDCTEGDGGGSSGDAALRAGGMRPLPDALIEYRESLFI